MIGRPGFRDVLSLDAPPAKVGRLTGLPEALSSLVPGSRTSSSFYRDEVVAVFDDTYGIGGLEPRRRTRCRRRSAPAYKHFAVAE